MLLNDVSSKILGSIFRLNAEVFIIWKGFLMEILEIIYIEAELIAYLPSNLLSMWL